MENTGISAEEQAAIATQEQLQRSITEGNNAANNAAAETAKALIHAAFTLALHRPRDIRTAKLNIERECRVFSFAEKTRYELRFGGTTITGPTIRLMELIKREYQNLYTIARVTYDGAHSMRMDVTIIDLETNTSYSEEISFAKTVERKGSGKYTPKGRTVISSRECTDDNGRAYTLYTVIATEQEIAAKREALVSKAIRKLVERIVPRHLIDDAMQVAEETIQKRIHEDPHAARESVIKRFFRIGIMPTDIEIFLQHQIDQCLDEEVSLLLRICTSIEDGQSKWVDFAAADESANSAQEKASSLLDKFAKDEKDAAVAQIMALFLNAGWTESEAREFLEAKTKRALPTFTINDLRNLYTWVYKNILTFEGGDNGGGSGEADTEQTTMQ